MPQAFFMMPKMEALENVREFLNIPVRDSLSQVFCCCGILQVALDFGQFDFGPNSLDFGSKRFVRLGPRSSPPPTLPSSVVGKHNSCKGGAPKGGAPPRILGPGFHTTAREPKHAHLRVPVFTNTTKILREDTQRDTKRAKLWRERTKKARNFGPHPFGAHFFGVPLFFGFGPPPSCPHPSGPRPVAHISGPHLLGPHLLAMTHTRSSQKWIGQNGIGQSRSGRRGSGHHTTHTPHTQPHTQPFAQGFAKLN